MITGIGTDIIEVQRIEKQIAEGSHFKDRIFSSPEIEYCESFKTGKAQHYAARFAAKEAVFKALGTGCRDGLAFRDIEVLNDELGRPDIRLSGKAAELARKQGVRNIQVSLSHLKDTACAVVIMEK